MMYPGLRVGDIFHGYCNGYFGRNGYGKKRVEGVGADWIVVRHKNGDLNFAEFRVPDDAYKLVEEWLKEVEEPEE